MKKQKNIFGIIVPMITPLLFDNNIDEASTKNVVEFLIGGGVHCIFILGSMGEGPYLSSKKQKEFTQIVVKQVNKRIPIILGVSDLSTERVLDNINSFYINGISAVVCTLPFYFPANKDEQVNHYKKIANESPVPVIMYDIPKRIKNEILISSISELIDHPNIIALKDSSGDLRKFRYLIEKYGGNSSFSMFLGDSSMIDVSVYLGADGVVPTDAHISPDLCVAIYEFSKKGKWDEARKKQRQLNKLREEVFSLYTSKSSIQSDIYKKYLKSKDIISQENVCQYVF